MLLLLVFLPVFVVGFTSITPREDDVHHVPLFRREVVRRGDRVDLDHLARSLNSLRAKYAPLAPRKSDLGRRASVADIATLNVGGDNVYLARIEVGTPSQSLDVVLDTGAADSWFATTACTDCSNGTLFDVSKSSSNRNTSERVTLNYSGGNASGTLLQDTVTLGPYTVPNQTFTGVTQTTTGVLSGSAVGLLGLAGGAISISGATPFWQALIDAGNFNTPEMSFYLTRFIGVATSATEVHLGGTLTLGGTNSSFYRGDIEFHPLPNVTQLGFWVVNIVGMTVNGNDLNIGDSTNDTAIINSNGPLLSGPTRAVQAFWAQVNGSQEEESGEFPGFYQFPCNTSIMSTLSFGGRAWPISPDDMNLGSLPNTQGFCLGALFDLRNSIPRFNNNNTWILGDAFLKNVYTVLRAGDSPAVGFAQLADGLNNSTTLAGASGSASPTNPPTATSSSRSAGVRIVSEPAGGFVTVALGAAIGVTALVLR